MSTLEPQSGSDGDGHGPTDDTTLTSAQLYESLTWLFGLISLIELGIILKLLFEGGR